MDADFNSIATYWKKSYVKQGEECEKYANSEEFKRMARLMAPGKSYYYIANFQNLNIEMMSDSVTNFIGQDYCPNNIKFPDILALALPEEIEKIQRKEQVIKDFFLDYISTTEVLNYKVIYTYIINDYSGKRRVILHQATPLSKDENGHFQHVFSLHTDISHLTSQSVEEISIIHNNGGKSYFNICSKKGRFIPDLHSQKISLRKLISDRELEIIKLLAQGLNAGEISAELFISTHTVRTHRKNILLKTNSLNTTQLVSRCIAAGLIEPKL
ncbi:response regulator transcription factor [Salegentibacter sp. HM20]